MIYYIIGGIILFIIVVICIILLVPLKIKINYKIKTNFDKSKEAEDINISNYIDLYILRIIKIKRIKITQNQKSNSDSKIKSKSKTNIILDTIYKIALDLLNYKKFDEALLNKKDLAKINNALSFNSMYIDIGVNLKNYILNAYVISFLNTVINMYIAKNVEKFNLFSMSKKILGNWFYLFRKSK